MNSKEPMHVFLAICVLFFSIQLTVDLIKLNYNLCHFIFGFGAPYFTGYFPCSLFKWHGINKLPFDRTFIWNWKWSLKPALLIVFLASFINEVIDDPIQNKIPFKDDWHNFAFDMTGLLVFCIFYYFFFRDRKRHA